MRAHAGYLMFAVMGLLFFTLPAGASGKRSGARVTDRIFKALPRPSHSFRLDPESGVELHLHDRAPYLIARCVRVYERRTGSGDDEETTTLEVRVSVNDESGFSRQPLGSETGGTEPFTHDGLPGTRFGLAGAEDSRLAAPLSEADRANALTVIRLYVGPAGTQSYLTALAAGEHPEHSPWDGKPAKNAGEIRTIVVEYYGPRAEVERLLHATKAAPLRALLSPTP